MTQFTASAWAADSSFSASYTPDNAGDERWSSAANERWAASGALPHWLRADLGTAKVCEWYRVDPGRSGSDPSAWTFEGSNDASSWTVLDTQTGQSFSALQTKSYQFTNATAYRYYRMNISAGAASAVSVAELALGDGDPHAALLEHVPASSMSAGNFTTGIVFVANVDIEVHALSAYVGTTTGTWNLRIRNSAGTVVASASYSFNSGTDTTGWREVAITPVTLPAGTYICEQWGGGNRYAIRSGGVDTLAGNYGPSGEVTIPTNGSVTFRSSTLNVRQSAGDTEPVSALGQAAVHGFRFSAATITATPQTVNAPALAAVADALNPTATAGTGRTVAAPSLALVAALLAPTATAGTGVTVAAPPISVTVAAPAPTVVTASGLTVAAPTLGLSCSAPAPIVSAGAAAAIAAPTLDLSTALPTPTIATAGGAVSVAAPALALTLEAPAPEVSNGIAPIPVAGVRVHTPDGILVVVPLVPATPPASLDLVTFERRSHVMAVLSAEHPDHDPHGACEHGDNTVVVEDVGTPQLWIGGQNVTFWRDKLTDVVRWESEVPFGDTAAAFEFPQMNPWDKPGEGDLDWLYPDAPVHVGIVDPEGGVRRVWSGFYDANGIGLAEDEDYPWEAKGTLWMAMHQVHEPRPLTEPVDIWVLIARTLNGVINRRWKRIPEEPIGITTLNRGARDSFLWEYVQELLSEAVTDDGRQWTISEVMPGVFRPVLKPASSVVHATVAVGTPGVDVDVRIDESTRVDGFTARAIGPDNGGWANVFYPGLQLLTPPPYPNDDASVIQIGDTDADTDSGDGVTAIERRLNELGRWGRVAEDGVWEASDAAVLYDAQGDLGILADGQPGPQTWNRLFNRSGEGISLDPLRLPLVVKDWVMPRLYDAAGVDIGPNPDHDPTRVPRIVPLDLGFGKTKRQGAKLCRALLAKYGEAGAAGTIRWELDPNETDRTRLSHLSNVEVLGHQGTDRVLQVSHKIVELDEGTATNPRQYVVTTRVDEHARDAMAVEDILEQRRSAIPDLSRRPGSLNRASRQVNDQRIPWDSESPCGYVRRTAINGAAGLPSVIPIPFAEVGKVAGIELTATQPFAFALFASLRITENRAQAIVGNPFASANPFRPHYDALEPYGIIEAWGQEGDRCGYSPETQSEGGDFTGRFILNTPVDYWTETVPYVSMVVWFDGASGFIQGRFIPAYEG